MDYFLARRVTDVQSGLLAANKGCVGGWKSVEVGGREM